MSTMYSVGQMNQLGDSLEAWEFSADDVTKLRSFSDGAALKSVVNGLAKIVPQFLRKVTTVSVFCAKKFVAKDQLQAANIGWTNSNFDKFFLNKVEENVGDTTLAVHRLEKGSKDSMIRTELGDRAEIQLAHFFELLKKQSKGEEGRLLVNGYANIAYIIGNDGNLWAVLALWFSAFRCWAVLACSVESPAEWAAGRQVLSRD